MIYVKNVMISLRNGWKNKLDRFIFKCRSCNKEFSWSKYISHKKRYKKHMGVEVGDKLEAYIEY